MGVAVFRRGVARLLAVVLFVLAPGLIVLPSSLAADPVVEGVVSFVDVPESSLFHKEIAWLAAEGISSGWEVGGGSRQYRPLESIARDAMAAFLYRKAGSPAYTPPAESPFIDVAPGVAFYREITWLASKGISTGWDVGNGKREYRPLSPIARDAMAAFLFRFAQPGEFAAPVQSPFVDVPAGGGFYKEITWLASSGISTGWDIGGGMRQYRPLEGIARDAMAAFLYRHAAPRVPANPLDPAAGTVTIAPDVDILGGEQLDSAVVSSGTVTLPSDKAQEIRPNDVLVAGVTAGTPEGLLARVIQVTRDPAGNTVVNTKPATLVEAVVSTPGLLAVAGTPVWSEFIPEEDVTETTGGAAASSEFAAPMAQLSADVFNKSMSWKKTVSGGVRSTDAGLSGDGSVTVESAVTAKAKAKMTLEAGFLQLKEASVTVTPSLTARHSLTVTGSLKGEVSAKLGELNSGFTFMVGPVPVVVTSHLKVNANFTLDGDAEIALTSSQTVSSDHGFRYREGAFNLVNTEPATAGIENDIKATASLSARASLDFDATVKLYSMAGITFGIGPYATTTITVAFANGGTNWSCPLELGVQGRLGVTAGIEMMGFKLGDWTKTVTNNWKHFTDDPCQGTPVILPETPVKLIVATTTLPAATVGQFYEAALNARGGSKPYAWSLANGGLPDGLRLDAASGAISGTPTTTGTAEVTVQVTDVAGARASAVFSIAVTNAKEENFALTGVRSLFTGGNSTYALLSDGTVWSWGQNDYGQLGHGTVFNSSLAAKVVGLEGIQKITVAWNGNTVYALKEDGTVFAWGRNESGQLGNGTNLDSSIPVRVAGLTDVRSVATSSYGLAAYAVKADGTVWSWGDNREGQLGNGTLENAFHPVQVHGLTDVTSVNASGFWWAYALKSDGTVWAWGNNRYGQLGIDSYASSMVPIQVRELSGVTSISAAGFYWAYALKRDGTVWAWGHNGNGQLGDGSTVESRRPRQVRDLYGVQAIVAGYYSAYAVKGDGAVWAWGYNSHGQLGNDSVQDSSLPVQSHGLIGVSNITAQESAYALKFDGTMWSWGNNAAGQLGVGSTSSTGVPAKIAGLLDVRQIASGLESAYALTADGKVWSFGSNAAGQLGNGTDANSPTPVQVASGS